MNQDTSADAGAPLAQRLPHRLARRWAFEAFGGDLVERHDTLPAPAGTEVTVRVSHCGVCHSDLHIRDGGFDLGNGQRTPLARAGVTPPVTMGHEIAGTVVECGPDAQGVAVGDTVVVYPWIGCGACAACDRGDDQLCLKQSRNLGLQQPGGYGTLVRVPDARYLVPLGSLDVARGATLACAGITAMGAVKKLGALDASHTVAVIGCGGVGMTAVALLAATSQARIVAIDPDPAKREAALAQGAALAFDPGAATAVRDITVACQQDIAGALDFVGSAQTAALGAAIVRRTGTVVIVGLFGGEFRLPMPMFPLRSLTITGSYVGNVADLRELVALAQRVGLPPTPLTRRPLDEINAVLADLAAGRVLGRTVLDVA